MAIPFLQEKKRKQYLNWILAIAILIGALWFGRNYLAKSVPPPPPPPKEKAIEINLETLKHPAFQELQIFEEIPPFEGEIGRENPFLPY